MQPTANKHYFWGFDCLRLIAAFGIIGCHLVLPDITEGASFVKRFTDLNVGVFATIAGFFSAYTLQLDVQFPEFLKRRTKKLLLPFYLWSVFYICIDIAFDTFMGKPLTFQPASLHYWYNALICGHSAAQMWFLISLFYTQLLCFIFIKKSFSFQSHWVSAGLTLLALAGIHFAHTDGYWTTYFLRLLSFFLLGIAFFRERHHLQKIPFSIIYALLLIGFILIACNFQYGFLGECVLSIPMLLWGLKFNPKNATIQTFGKTLGAFSFGVYLVHPIFTRIIGVTIARLGLPSTAFVFIADWVLAFICSLVCTYCIIRIIRRFPRLAYLLPV